MEIKAWHIFVISVMARLFLIGITWGAKDNIDLGIYRDAGQLVLNKVNPYQFDQKPQIRDSLRTDTIAYNAYVSQSPEAWNGFAGSNLPLANYLFAMLEWLGYGGISFRLFFALADSFLAVVCFKILLNSKTWSLLKYQNLNLENALIALLLFGLSPILLYWGTVWPEHKGTAILLILMSIYFYQKQDKALFAGVFMGLSVAFIGISALLLPFIAWAIYIEFGTKKTIQFVLTSTTICIIFILPYMPQVFEIMLKRSQSYTPNHASMWVIMKELSNVFWQRIHVLSGVFVLFLGAWLFIKRQLKPLELGAFLLLFYLGIWLLAGSLDRINISFSIFILVFLFNKNHQKLSALLLFIHFIYGIILFIPNHFLPQIQYYDSAFNLIFIGAVLYYLFNLTVSKHKI